MIIAVDGPAAAGKGTLARGLARHFGYRFLDTGSLYRMAARALLDGGHQPEDRAAAIAAARTLDPKRYAEADLRSEAVAAAASIVAAIPEVRAALLGFQRDFAKVPPGAVLDGRDIGTVVCPDADVKFFITASPEIRARRRSLELAEQGTPAPYQQVLADIHARDARDRSRPTAPLVPAPEAHVIDTSDMTIEKAVAILVDAVTSRLASRDLAET